MKPLTVCESLANRKKLNGEPAAIVGRIDCGISLIDRTCFLVEDRCDRRVTTGSGVWPNQVYIEYWEEGMPKPPSPMPEVDQAALTQKLSLIGNSTTLGVHSEPRFITEGGNLKFAGRAEVKDEWGIAFGTFLSAPRLQEAGCEDEPRCGGFDGAPAALIILPGGLRTITKDNKVAER